MKNRNSISWLFDELPQLVNKGVLSSETAENLRLYYTQMGYTEQKRNFFTIFAIIGFLLIGLGIILILAHNWETLTRPVRLAISVGALISAQIFAGYSLWFKRNQTSFTESSSVFLTFMIGAAISLVGQTYHLNNDFDAFLLAWIFLTLPLIYLMRSIVTAVLYIGLITFWVVESSSIWPSKQLVWLLVALVLPFYKSLWTKPGFVRHTTNLGFILALSLPICFYAAFQEEITYLWHLSFISLFGIMYLADVKMSFYSRLWQNAPRPFKMVGCAGIIGLSFLLSFKFIWDRVYMDAPYSNLAFLMAGLVFLLITRTFRRLKTRQILLGIAPLLAGLGCLLVQFEFSGLGAAFIFNIYLFAVSLSIIISGVNEEMLGRLNVGMFILAALIIARFFDFNISFEARGAAFVLVGLCLLLVNLVMVKHFKRKKGQA